MQLFLPLKAKPFKTNFTEDRKSSWWNLVVEQNTNKSAKTHGSQNLQLHYTVVIFMFSQRFIFH